MNENIPRLALPDPGDDSHPLDWYPGDEPESRTLDGVNAWVDEVLTRRGDVVKLQGDPGRDSGPTEVSNERWSRPMQDDRTTLSIALAAVSAACEALADAEPMALDEAVSFSASLRSFQVLLHQVQQCQLKRAILAHPWPTPADRGKAMEQAGFFASMTSDGGRVYFARSQRTGLIKIGTTKYPWRRLMQVRRMDESDLELLGTVAGERSEEKALHKQFAADRVTGEWFRETPSLIAYINAHAELHERDKPTKKLRRAYWRPGMVVG